MDRNILSDRPHCAELRYFQQKLPLPARTIYAAATGKPEGASALGLLLLLRTWMASWAVLVSSSSSWLR
jgi:hypothetical protein